MKPYAELLEFNQPNPIRKPGFTRIRDAFPGLGDRYEAFFDDGLAPSYVDTHNAERIMEFAGRWDYGPDNAAKLGETATITPTSSWTIDKVPLPPAPPYKVPIIQKYIQMGHESMIEMGDATFFLECSRVVSHEIVRHRIASYQQESQRFVKYDNVDDDIFYDDYGIDPELHVGSPSVDGGHSGYEPPTASDAMAGSMRDAMWLYKDLRSKGVPPQIARYVLPNAMRTRLIMKTNVREWRHILRLRLDKSAQPEMRELMQQVYDQLVEVFPNAMYGVLDSGRGVR